MSKVYAFRNKGVIDPLSITTFGVSSKEGKNPIGLFGTGLKYAIAVLLRLKCSIEIKSGDQVYTFSTRKQTIRVNEFDMILMNGEPCGFTTELGKTWEAWQAFRELACNAKDEDGEWYEAGDPDCKPTSNETVVVVSGQPFEFAWAERHSILLESTPISVGTMSEIHSGQSNWIYYRGVRCAKLERPSLYTYNLTYVTELTEDRTFKDFWTARNRCTTAVGEAKDVDIIKSAVLASDKFFEQEFQYSGALSTEFEETVLSLLKKFTAGVSESAKNRVKNRRISELLAGEKFKFSKVDAVRVDKAKGFLLKIGYDVREYPIVFSEFLGEGVLGMAQNGTIYISKRALMMGTKMLAGTILEEYVHLKHDVYDCTRGMQNWLIDALMGLGEQVTGEPL